MKTAVWIYIFMFVAIFDLHAQYPMLSPFALSLGAAPSFIGFIMGMYSITHIPGNLIAGYGIDRYGSKIFIVSSMFGAGLLLLWQASIDSPMQLLVIRSISGFVLAFLSPACTALLASLAKNAIQQGNLMSGKGLVNTIASVASPAAGALLVASIGFAHSFTALGVFLIVAGVIALIFIRDVKIEPDSLADDERKTNRLSVPLNFYIFPLALSCSQGILFFELPLIPNQTVMTSGILFSIVSIGSLVTLSMLFLNRFSSIARNAWGGFFLALIFYGMAVKWPIELSISLFLIGMCKGVIYPAIATFLTSLSGRGQYGKVFAMLSIAYSIGAFIGPLLAGYTRETISPYFLAFLCLMVALVIVPFGKFISVPLFNISHSENKL